MRITSLKKGIFTFFFLFMVLISCKQNEAPDLNTTEPLPEDSGPMDFNDQPESLTVGLEKEEIIRVDEPEEGEAITSPLEISGELRGFWFFEGRAPFRLIDSEEKVLAEGSVIAQDKWMTEDLVPFSAEVSFEVKDGQKKGFLVLSRANPSGLPENEQHIRIPVNFKE